MLQFGTDDYEVALFSLSISLGTGFDPQTTGSLFIYSNFVDSVILGSSRVNLLRRVYIDSVGRSEINPVNLQYVPLSGSSFSVGRIEIRDATGAVSAMDATKGTSVTMAIRRKIYGV